ncbi:hypothetical protein ACKI2N_008030 [Cupriavidus sp. 30B13]|uniref:hypothetical protein n=1 Tax=Cupriavidus sp. 30B13 TaxID=3384241 RepID=UPI003B8F75B6
MSEGDFARRPFPAGTMAHEAVHEAAYGAAHGAAAGAALGEALGEVVAVGAIRPCAGDLVVVRSRIDPAVEFHARLALPVPDGTWKAAVFHIERAGRTLAAFDGVGVDDEVIVSMDQIVSVLKCVPVQ